MWYTTRCAFCLQRRPAPATTAPTQPIQTQNVGDRVQVDLIDIRNRPSDKYKWILHTHDHKSRFQTLWPLVDKSAPAVVEAMTFFLAASHQMKIWQSDNGGEFKGTLLTLMQRYGIRVIKGSACHPQSQGMNEQSNGQIKRRLAS